MQFLGRKRQKYFALPRTRVPMTLVCMRYLVAFFLVFLPSLHAQTPSTTDTDKATVYFYRLRDNYAALLKPSVYCDKTQVARMRNGRFVSTTLPAGVGVCNGVASPIVASLAYLLDVAS